VNPLAVIGHSASTGSASSRRSRRTKSVRMRCHATAWKFFTLRTREL
jgi:hypothetical protein